MKKERGSDRKERVGKTGQANEEMPKTDQTEEKESRQQFNKTAEQGELTTRQEGELLAREFYLLLCFVISYSC